jgi:hypothetical protein
MGCDQHVIHADGLTALFQICSKQAIISIGVISEWKDRQQREDHLKLFCQSFRTPAPGAITQLVGDVDTYPRRLERFGMRLCLGCVGSSPTGYSFKNSPPVVKVRALGAKGPRLGRPVLWGLRRGISTPKNRKLGRIPSRRHSQRAKSQPFHGRGGQSPRPLAAPWIVRLRFERSRPL